MIDKTLTLLLRVAAFIFTWGMIIGLYAFVQWTMPEGCSINPFTLQFSWMWGC